MATLTKEENGIIYSEYFNESPSSIWSLTPSDVDCLRFENDGLHILSSDEYVTYTFKEPNSNDNQLNYCLIAEIIHVPITKDDIVVKDNYTDTYYFTDDFCKREGIDYSTTYNDVWITTNEGEVLMDKVDIDKYGYAFYSNSLIIDIYL